MNLQSFPRRTTAKTRDIGDPSPHRYRNCPIDVISASPDLANIKMLFAAVHESVSGTKLPTWSVRFDGEFRRITGPVSAVTERANQATLCINEKGRARRGGICHANLA